MDLQDLQRRAQAARETVHSIGCVTYTLRLPTSHEVLLAAHKAGVVGQAVGAAYLLLMRAVLEAAVVGWQGVRVGDVAPGGDDAAAPLPWDAGAVPLLFDAKPGHESALRDVLSARMAERATALEADAKN